MKHLLTILIVALTVSAKGGLTLFWSPNPTNELIQYYRVFWALPPYGLWIPMNKDFVGTNAPIEPVMIYTNRVYKFRVTATNPNGESVPSDEVAWTNGLALVPTPVPYTNAPSKVQPIGIRNLP